MPPPGSGSPPSIAFDEVAGDLRRFLFGVVRNQALVDDLLQTTYVRAIERGAGVRPEAARSWLFQVAYREALAIRRREDVRDRNHRKLAQSGLPSSPLPDQGMIRDETIRAVRDALDRLPENQKRVVIARMSTEKTFAEIAEELGLPLGTVLTQMRRGLEKMRQFIDPGA